MISCIIGVLYSSISAGVVGTLERPPNTSSVNGCTLFGFSSVCKFASETLLPQQPQRRNQVLKPEQLRGVTLREVLSRSTAICLHENFVELSVPSKACGIGRLGQVFLLWLAILFPKATQADRITVARERNADLAMKCAAQMGLAHTTGPCQSSQIVGPIAFAQQLDRAMHRRVQRYAVAQHLAIAPAAPAKHQQMVKTGIQPSGSLCAKEKSEFTPKPAS